MTMVKEGQPWPRQRPRALRVAQKLVLGPNGLNAAVVDWHVTAFPVPVAREWNWHYGDDDASSLWPLSWKPIGGFAVKRAFVDEARAAHPTARPGAMYLPASPGHVVAGMLPEGRELGTDLSGDRYTLVGRVGRGTLRMTPVMIVPETSKILVPEPDAVIPVRIVHNAARQDFRDAPVV